MIRNFVASKSAPDIGRSEMQKTASSLNRSAQPGEVSDTHAKGPEEQKNKKTKSTKYKPFKNTALVLRDVKNSLELVSWRD